MHRALRDAWDLRAEISPKPTQNNSPTQPNKIPLSHTHPMTPPPTPRLTFRSWTPHDTPLAEALWCDPEVTHFFGGAMTPEQAHDRLTIERERELHRGFTYWPIFRNETGEFAGCAGLRPWQMDPATTEAGVHLMRPAWGQRLGEEALRAVLTHAFETLHLPAIVAGHGLGHANSQNLLERVGFRYTHNIAWGPKSIEVRMYAIQAASWPSPTATLL